MGHIINNIIDLLAKYRLIELYVFNLSLLYLI